MVRVTRVLRAPTPQLPSDEVWRPVAGYVGKYEVSSYGRVKSLKRRRVLQDRILVPNTFTNAGHQRVSLQTFEHTKRDHQVHRLVALAFLGPEPKGKPLVCHRDGVASNNRLDNLYWGSQSDNMYDRVRHGRCHHTNKTHCPYRHLLKAPNLVESFLPARRKCLACARTRATLQKNPTLDHQLVSDQKYSEIMSHL